MPEEKRTDVNIAVFMLDDAYRDMCDQFVIFSSDSDLVPAVNMVRLRFPKKENHRLRSNSESGTRRRG